MEREEWRYFTKAPGELCVMIIGIYRTHLLCVANSDMPQDFLLQFLLASAKEEASYGWTMLIAWGTKVPLMSVRILDGEYTTAIIRKMCQSSVEVLNYQFISNYISDALPHARRAQRSSMVHKSCKLSMEEIQFREGERIEKDQKVRCERDLKPHPGHLPNKTEKKSLLKRKSQATLVKLLLSTRGNCRLKKRPRGQFFPFKI